MSADEGDQSGNTKQGPSLKGKAVIKVKGNRHI